MMPGRSSEWSQEIAAVYAGTRNIIKQYKLLKSCDVRKTSKKVSIVINNLWRIDRNLDERFKVSLYMFSLTEHRWLRINQKKIQWKDAFDRYFYKTKSTFSKEDLFFPWPQLYLLSFGEGKKTYAPITNAIKCALIGAGYQNLPDWNADQNEFYDRVYNLDTTLSDSEKASLPIFMANSLIGQYFHILGNSLDIGMRCLRKALWEHVVDRELASALIAMGHGRLAFDRYLSLLPHADSILRVAHEHRNLLPLLKCIPQSYWSEKGLFGRTFWVKSQQHHRCAMRDIYFTSEIPLRWLRKAPAKAVMQWTQGREYGLHGNMCAVIENISRANLNLPSTLLSGIICKCSHRCTGKVCSEMQRLYRLYADYCMSEWRQKRVLKSTLLSDTFDWMDAEGLKKGLPDKNATWSSIQRHVREWHERYMQMEREQAEEENRQYSHLAWDSLIGEMEIDGAWIVPLVSSKALVEEGLHMHHCVASYAPLCIEGQCRIFSIIDPSGQRSTLSIEPHSENWGVQQHRGICNAQVSDEIKKIGEKISCLYEIQSKKYQSI